MLWERRISLHSHCMHNSFTLYAQYNECISIIKRSINVHFIHSQYVQTADVLIEARSSTTDQRSSQLR